MNARIPPTLTADQILGTADKIGDAHSKPLLLCFSHLRWDFVWQRPQHILSRAANQYHVVFFEEPIYEDVTMPTLRESARGKVTVQTPVIPRQLEGTDVNGVLRQLVDRIVAADPVPDRIFWYYTPMALSFSRHIVPDLCIYDNMDELSAFRGAPANLLRLEEELFRRADLVFTGGQSLYESKQKRHGSVHLFPSSVDAAHFHQARNPQADPADQRDIRHPRFGFFGVIDERMNVDLVARVAKMRPTWEFVMIGPVVKIDPATLPRLSNVHWLGAKDYRELPTYLAGWDVGFMPFAINEATRFISPTKTPEFLAAGLPVVSTSIVDVVRPYGEKGLVAIAETAEDVVIEGQRLLAQKHNPVWLRRVDRHLSAMSWDKTWSAMRHLMQSRLETVSVGGDHSVAVSA